ncbi:MAG: IRE (iron responsive element), partial [Pirellulaceae bacterium]
MKKGIAFLILGTQYNRDEPGLLNSVGWFVGQKMGRSDENRQFRRLFREDRDFHAEFFKHGIDVDNATAQGKPDSWLVSRLWYLKGEDAVARGKPLRLKSPLLYYNSAPMALINHAAALEQDDAIFGPAAQYAWARAHDG